jgi:dolichol-phosphate mannosyltransferase
VRRFLLFGAVGASGVAVNTGTLLALAALGFDPLAWPIWAAAESAILWNYALNRRVTWRDRAGGGLLPYNAAALAVSWFAVQTTTALVLGGVALALASLAGIGAAMAVNYAVLDRLVFARPARRPGRPALRLLGRSPFAVRPAARAGSGRPAA